EIDYVASAKTLGTEGANAGRFGKVFTKLRVLGFVQYRKILLMDIDLLVQDNIDHLFDMEAPMAMVRGPEVGYKHGDRVAGGYFFSGARDDGYSWGQGCGINAGVMLLQPDADVLAQMLLEVCDEHHPEHIAGNGPEQDYLSRYYASDWRHLSVAYNFQLHQAFFALHPKVTSADRMSFLHDPSLVKIVH
ncbi:unnamed protein product, partial [Prorocentrum cordatum]